MTKFKDKLCKVGYHKGFKEGQNFEKGQLIKAKKLLKILLENYVSEPEVFSDGSCEDNELRNLINEVKQFINSEVK